MKSTKYGSAFFLLWISAAQAADYVVTQPEERVHTPPADNQTLGEYVDDAMITAKAKAALLDDAGLSMFDISVDTYQGNVQLSGFVDSQDDIGKAAEIVRRVKGVKTVENNLRLKNPNYPD